MHDLQMGKFPNADSIQNSHEADINSIANPLSWQELLQTHDGPANDPSKMLSMESTTLEPQKHFFGNQRSDNNFNGSSILSGQHAQQAEKPLQVPACPHSSFPSPSSLTIVQGCAVKFTKTSSNAIVQPVSGLL